MKTFCLMLFMFCGSFGGDPIADLSNEVIEAVKKGDAAEIAKNFNDKVDLKIFDQEDVYSKAQAESVLKDFFAKNKVKGFTTSHSSTVKAGNQFVVGTLDTSTGKYRLSFLIKKIGEKYLISQFRIENESD
ncbi:MAG: DUF4783 domain-containing protein [Bacteroidia bacterium]|nr:DUF4783 domain-containing protein [Bacteroidia bacterium]